MIPWMTDSYKDFIKKGKRKDSQASFKKYMDKNFGKTTVQVLLLELFWETYQLRKITIRTLEILALMTGVTEKDIKKAKKANGNSRKFRAK